MPARPHARCQTDCHPASKPEYEARSNATPPSSTSAPAPPTRWSDPVPLLSALVPRHPIIFPRHHRARRHRHPQRAHRRLRRPSACHHPRSPEVAALVAGGERVGVVGSAHVLDVREPVARGVTACRCARRQVDRHPRFRADISGPVAALPVVENVRTRTPIEQIVAVAAQEAIVAVIAPKADTMPSFSPTYPPWCGRGYAGSRRPFTFGTSAARR